ncbi:glycosyltransferase family 4 protein [Mangrovimicrobium sediminis]|nr:glycosyltransferase family 4 protein [Haliea sp. SAOS-164]
MISQHDVLDPNAMSGTPNKAYQALCAAGYAVTPIFPQPRPHTLPFRAMRRLREYRDRLLPPSPRREYEAKFRAAREAAAQVAVELGKHDVDALLGVCAGEIIAFLPTDLPMVFASDATAATILESYAMYATRSDGLKRAKHEIEQLSLDRASHFAAAAEYVAASAIADYHQSPEKVCCIEFGSNVVNAGEPISIRAPDPGNFQLVLVAADPVRKRLDFCVEVVEALHQRGWNTTLTFIGGESPIARESPHVNWLGRLQLSDPRDQARHREALQACDWMILPSRAEAFGIAPCEAAQFARPSIVSDVGGLPTVVRHGETGIVMPAEASAQDYAEALIAASSDAARYTALCENARERAENVLNWDAWARRVGALVERCVAQREAADRA